MTIGERIKALRKQNGMTQENLAEYLCVSYQAVSKWECG
ncbi:MAG: helix-turn-helix transcriptional regulator, partial [Ruminococcaceae bacterium]|nr:helix-turn-helix transcriptional regulator [Oscillospiraceae bacterium]